MREKILTVLERYELDSGGNLVSLDLIRALSVDGAKLSFVLEAPSANLAQKLEAERTEIQKKLLQIIPMKMLE